MTGGSNDSGLQNTPPITAAMREAARRQPNGWVYVIDPAFDPNGRVPPEGIAGAYPVDDNGEIVPTFQPNERYRPTPKGLHLPEPTDALDDVLQRTTTGWASEDRLRAVLLDSNVLVIGQDPADDERHALLVHEDDQGRLAVYAFTAEAHAQRAQVRHSRRVAVRDLLREWPPGADLVLNAGGPASVRIPADKVDSLAA
jgi:hypothetical protein